MSVTDVFQRIAAALKHAGIQYMVSGSFASSYYGAQRSTRDIDLVIDATPSQLRTLADDLRGDQYYFELDSALESLRRQSLSNIIDFATGWKIDLIFLKSRPYDQEAFRRRQPIKMHDVDLFIASVEDTIISKLEWSKMGQSQRQLEDVAVMLQAESESLDRSYLKKWITELAVQKQWEDARQLAGITEFL